MATNKPERVAVRVERDGGRILVFLDRSANYGHLVYWGGGSGHGECSSTYYRDTKREGDALSAVRVVNYCLAYGIEPDSIRIVKRIPSTCWLGKQEE